MARPTALPRERRLHLVYVLVRVVAVAGFLCAALVMPPGPGAAAAFMGFGVVGLAACIGTTAGGRGEHASALAEQQRLARVRAPQGEWPPYPDPDGPAR